jgi:SNF2 family DNA or RNA helicase
MVQAEDRIHRIGTTKGAIIVYMVAKGTIEHTLCKIVQAKAEVLDQTLDGEIQSDSINIHKQLEQHLTKKGA